MSLKQSGSSHSHLIKSTTEQKKGETSRFVLEGTSIESFTMYEWIFTCLQSQFSPAACKNAQVWPLQRSAREASQEILQWWQCGSLDSWCRCSFSLHMNSLIRGDESRRASLVERLQGQRTHLGNQWHQGERWGKGEFIKCLTACQMSTAERSRRCESQSRRHSSVIMITGDVCSSLVWSKVLVTAHNLLSGFQDLRTSKWYQSGDLFGVSPRGRLITLIRWSNLVQPLE